MRQVLGAKTTKRLGIVLLISGAVMMILQIACTAIVTEERGLYAAHYGGTGIWCGLLILVTGIIGCCAATQKTNALVNGTYLLSEEFLL